MATLRQRRAFKMVMGQYRAGTLVENGARVLTKAEAEMIAARVAGIPYLKAPPFTAADNTKLDGIQEGATAGGGGGDMSAATYDPTAKVADAFDMDNMVAGATNLLYTAGEASKLAGVEASATADMSGAEIKAAYEVEASAFTDAQFTKLSGIETAATADQTDAEIKTAAAPAIFYAENTSTANLAASAGWTVIPYGTPDFEDTGYSESAGVVTIGSELNGKRVEIKGAVYVGGATGRMSLKAQIQLNGGTIKEMGNYCQRDVTHTFGGVEVHVVTTVATSDTIQLRGQRTVGTGNMKAGYCSLYIKTLD